jgi:prepilin-type N-terminal cleavage/methylation domain-containing protein
MRSLLISSTRQSGFTLIEIAIVLLIVTVLLGYTVAMFPVQQELKQYNHANDEMNSIVDHLIAYAQVHGRLPCPDDSPPDGLENATGGPPTDDCDVFYGYLPGRTLGIDGKYNDAGSLIDPWGNEYRYAVSHSDASATGKIDMVTPDGIRDEGLSSAAQAADLYLCTDSTVVGNQLDCDALPVGDEAIGKVAAVVVSRGKSFDPAASSNIETENTDDFLLDPPSDRVFIFSPRRDDYDDVVKWVSTNLLFSKMIEADKLP